MNDSVKKILPNKIRHWAQKRKKIEHYHHVAYRDNLQPIILLITVRSTRDRFYKKFINL